MWRSRNQIVAVSKGSDLSDTANVLLLRIDAKDVGSNRRVAVVRGRVSGVEEGREGGWSEE